jgi:hypothetical protein
LLGFFELPWANHLVLFSSPKYLINTRFGYNLGHTFLKTIICYRSFRHLGLKIILCALRSAFSGNSFCCYLNPPIRSSLNTVSTQITRNSSS